MVSPTPKFSSSSFLSSDGGFGGLGLGASAGFAGSFDSGVTGAAAGRTGGFLTSKGFTDDLTGGFRLPSGVLASSAACSSGLAGGAASACGSFFT